MPKIPPTTPERLAGILKKLGFVLDRIRGSHHVFLNPITGHRAIVPFHKKELPRGTFFEILRQASISREEYEKLL